MKHRRLESILFDDIDMELMPPGRVVLKIRSDGEWFRTSFDNSDEALAFGAAIRNLVRDSCLEYGRWLIEPLKEKTSDEGD